MYSTALYSSEKSVTKSSPKGSFLRLNVYAMVYLAVHWNNLQKKVELNERQSRLWRSGHFTESGQPTVENSYRHISDTSTSNRYSENFEKAYIFCFSFFWVTHIFSSTKRRKITCVYVCWLISGEFVTSTQMAVADGPTHNYPKRHLLTKVVSTVWETA